MEGLALYAFQHPIRLLFMGWVLGMVVATGLHFAWVNTVYRQHLEIQFSKRVAYYTYEQNKCVAKWKKTPLCVDWTTP